MNRMPTFSQKECCRFYRQGHCTRELHLNPGYEQHICLLMRALFARYEDFLDKAEVFHLNEQQAARLWPNMQQPATNDCPWILSEQQQKTGFSPEACHYYFDGMCVRIMPECHSVCRDYTVLRVELCKDTPLP